MAKQLVPDTAQFRIIQRFTPPVGIPVDFMNVVYVRNTVNPWTVAHLQATAQLIEAAWIGQLESEQVVNVGYVEIQCEDLGADPGNQHIEPMAGFGDDTNDPAPLSVAALVKIPGATGIAPRRGRLFFGGLGEGGVTGNSLTAEKAAAIQSDMRSFYNSALSAGDAFVIVSRRFNNQPRPVGVTNLVQPLSITVGQRLAVQKDRRD